ncbi:MAG TPA: DUF885 family protein, partial [Vicinamibacteria bacterium]
VVPVYPEEPPVAAESELRDLVERYSTDLDALSRRYPVPASSERFARLARYYDEWKKRAEGIDFAPLGVEGRIDHVLLRNELEYEARLLAREESWLGESAALLPFAEDALALNDARLRMDPMDSAKAAATLDSLSDRIDSARKEREATADSIDRLTAFRAQEQIGVLAEALRSWYEFYSGYDPLFTWWGEAPYKEVTRALDDYKKFLRETVLEIGPGEEEPIVGTPIGRDALVADLASELVPYTPEELLELAEREFQWCENELRKAARDMGLGDDGMAAIEKVKNLYVPPGEQPNLIRDLAREAEAYLEQHGLVTVPPLAKEVWRMRMMTPERQKVNPFFTGGEVISVSYPTDTMDHQDKLMSLRGNNIHFARATVHHELIPGHHLQAFMNQRYNAHRRAFRTPFWGEGWALYWEMLLWDRGFQQSPENRVGMLFWRMHRAARIVFSLGFHLGRMTPEECIELLVERGGHELANAAAEVRRSFNGSYPPLYQLAYMMGGLQFRALHEEMVGSGKMTDREFHDAVLQGGSMPVEMVRVRLRKETISEDYEPGWKFLAQPVTQ